MKEFKKLKKSRRLLEAIKCVVLRTSLTCPKKELISTCLSCPICSLGRVVSSPEVLEKIENAYVYSYDEDDIVDG